MVELHSTVVGTYITGLLSYGVDVQSMSKQSARELTFNVFDL